jgi:desulfoferrodoxin (superoxide reductase-like protein)
MEWDWLHLAEVYGVTFETNQWARNHNTVILPRRYELAGWADLNCICVMISHEKIAEAEDVRVEWVEYAKQVHHKILWWCWLPGFPPVIANLANPSLPRVPRITQHVTTTKSCIRQRAPCNIHILWHKGLCWPCFLINDHIVWWRLIARCTLRGSPNYEAFLIWTNHGFYIYFNIRYAFENQVLQ